MKKIICLLVCFIILVHMAGCASPAVPAGKTTSAAATGVPSKTAENPSPNSSAPVKSSAVTGKSALQALYEQMETSGLLPEMTEVPENIVLDFYGFDKTMYADAVFYVSFDSMLADEIVLVTAKDEAAAKEIEALLNVRLEAKATEAKSYSPEQYAIIKKCSVIKDGTRLAMIVGKNGAGLTDIYQKMK